MEPNYDVYMIHEFSVNPFFMNKFNFLGRFRLEDAEQRGRAGSGTGSVSVVRHAARSDSAISGTGGTEFRSSAGRQQHF